MTTLDKETGLPMLGGGSKVIPIDPALLPELREKISTAEQIEAKSLSQAINLFKALAVGASIGAQYMKAEAEADAFILKLLALHNVKREDLDPERPFDWEKGLLNLKPQE